ncbi:phospholipid phosphatase 3-like isoform X2 [Littorina saxatilis]
MIKPRHQGFFCNDESIKYPYVASTVNNNVVVAVTLALPVVLMAAVELRAWFCVCVWRGSESGQRPGGPWPVVGAYLIYFFGYLLLNMTVVLLKLTTGQLRPHFIHICKPNVNLSICHGYVSDYNCTNTEFDYSLLESAHKSFPSGHAASSVYMALFMVLYFEQRLILRHYPVLRLTLYAVLTMYAVWCSATRVSDHMHHVMDVVAGGLLGTVMAVGMYYRGAQGCFEEADNQLTMADVEEGRNTFGSTNNSALKTDDVEEDGSVGMEAPGSPGSPVPLLFRGLQEAPPGGRHGSVVLERFKNNFGSHRRISLR